MNKVFDLGGVVFRFQPDEILESKFKNKLLLKRIKAEIFYHTDWYVLDKGIITLNEFINRSASRTGFTEKNIN